MLTTMGQIDQFEIMFKMILKFINNLTLKALNMEFFLL